MFSLIIFLPLLGSASAAFFGRFLGHKGSIIITLSCLLCATFLSIVSFYSVFYSNEVTYITLFSWFNFGFIMANIGFVFDPLSVSMLFVVTFISFLVHLYSTGYMSDDPHLSRFLSYLSFFTFFMLILVTADNFLQLFLGWEGVGLCSYLLIGFWYTRISANKAALKALIINRIGDFFVLFGICFLYMLTTSVDYSSVFLLIPYIYKFGNLYTLGFISFICLFFFLGAMGKSAQIGLHTWLPDAMEGPTPVSALIHAATMVTAGVFLIIRCSILFECSSYILLFISFIGGFTAIFASVVGLVQNDIKKVIAYSTCSQLGYMVFACGLSAYHVSFFHLINHAFFKALLFLSAGAIIHSLSDEQDMRKMGGLLLFLPFTYFMILIGSLSLMGFPFLTGFYSKEFILELAYSKYDFVGLYVYWLGVLAACGTSFYSWRLIFLVFFGQANGSLSVYKQLHESSWLLLIPLLILSIFSIFFGYIFRELFVGIGTEAYGSSLSINIKHYHGFDYEFIPFLIKIFPLFVSILGAILALFLYLYMPQVTIKFLTRSFFLNFYRFLSKKWHFDLFYNQIITFPFLKACYKYCFLILDKGLIEILGPFGLSKIINFFGIVLQKLHTGFLSNYISLTLCVFLVCWYYFFL